jgi:hypothetical protein
VPRTQSFVAELFKRQPLGVALVAVGVFALIFVAVALEAKLNVGPPLGIGVLVTFFAWVVGGPLTIRAASRIQAERRGRASERSSQLWG